jgi:hypothetical protein
MQELRLACLDYGKCTYHEVAKESEYRRVEKELIR